MSTISQNPELSQRLAKGMSRLDGQSKDEYELQVETAIKEVASVLLDSGVIGFNVIDNIASFLIKEMDTDRNIITIVSRIVLALLDERVSTSKTKEQALLDAREQITSKLSEVIDEILQPLLQRDDISPEEIAGLIDSALADYIQSPRFQ